MAKSNRFAFADAYHYAKVAQKLLGAHAALATQGAYARMLGIRDLIMADNLEYFVSRERGRGKVLVFSASGHLQRSMAQWRLPPGDEVKEWWPAGAQLTQTLGSRYAVIGMGLGESEANGIGQPEPGTLEARLTEGGGAVSIPTHRTQSMPTEEIEALPVRSGSTLNPTYFPLGPQSFTDFDWLVVLGSTTYPRGAHPLTDWGAG